jgi:hypothetical protein
MVKFKHMGNMLFYSLSYDWCKRAKHNVMVRVRVRVMITRKKLQSMVIACNEAKLVTIFFYLLFSLFFLFLLLSSFSIFFFPFFLFFSFFLFSSLLIFFFFSSEIIYSCTRLSSPKLFLRLRVRVHLICREKERKSGLFTLLFFLLSRYSLSLFSA